GLDHAVRNLFDQSRAEDRCGYPENQVVVRVRRVEVGLRQDAGGRGGCPCPPCERRRVVHTAISAPVRIELEPGLPDRSVQRDEEGNAVGASSFAANATCGFSEGLVPPVAGWTWQPRQLSR